MDMVVPVRSQFPHPGMGNGAVGFRLTLELCLLMNILDLYLFRFIEAQGQFIAAQFNLDRISQGRDFTERNLGLRRQPISNR